MPFTSISTGAEMEMKGIKPLLESTIAYLAEINVSG
jgi:hypothetical protein